MLVIIANDLPPAVRGRLKLYAVEPKPNVFVSGLKDTLANRLIDYLSRHCSKKSGILIFSQKRNAPGYSIATIGTTDRELISISGFQLIREPPKNRITPNL